MTLQRFLKPFQFFMDGLKSIVDVILTDITLINQKHDVVGEDDGKWRWMWENGKFFAQDVIRTEIHFGEPKEIVFQDAKKESV